MRLVVGLGTYRLLIADPFVATGIAAVYAGAAYFYAAFDVSFLGEAVEFDDRTDKIGHAVGLFGLSVTPVAFGSHYGAAGEATLPLVVAFLGAIAFLLFASEARWGDASSDGR
ncbi:hypothetical protein GJ633_08555 [Halorubrum sp. CBA1125]|nr:hypothetical protein [Halorubrum sp. CBA1125]